MKCEICNSIVNGTKGLSIHLTKKHKLTKVEMSKYYDKYISKQNPPKCYFCDNVAMFLNLTKGYHRICKNEECLGKTRATGTYEFLMYKYGLSEFEAKKEHVERAENRGKKIKKSFDILYDKDENFHKKRSHNTIEFWLNRGFSEKESKIKSENVMNMIHEKTFKKFKDNPEKYDDIRTSQLKYWLKKGYNEEDAKLKLKNRQTTFSLEICIKKYGETEGKKRWLKRQEKWQKNYKKSNFSKISQKLFWQIYNKLENDMKQTIKFATILNGEMDDSGKNNEFRLILDSLVLPDFIDLKTNKIIEFDGVYYHKNTPENIKRENKRNDMLKKHNYDVLHINENEYKQNKDKIVKQCIDFLKSKKKK